MKRGILILALALSGCDSPDTSKTIVERLPNGGTSSYNVADFKKAVGYCYHHQWQQGAMVPIGNFYAGDRCNGIGETAANRYWLNIQTDPSFDNF